MMAWVHTYRYGPIGPRERESGHPEAYTAIGSASKVTSDAPCHMRSTMGTTGPVGSSRSGIPPLGEPDASSTPEAVVTQQLLEPLRQEVQEQLSPLLRPEKREEAGNLVDRLMVTISEKFSGPLAHPAHLEAYERIVPGAAERLLAMAEGEQGHRHRSDRQAAQFDAFYSMTGLIFGFAIGVCLVVGGVAVAL